MNSRHILKAIIISLVLVTGLSACTAGFSKPATVTETAAETAAETTTHPQLKVSLGVTIGTAIDEDVMKATGISKYMDECHGIYVSKMTGSSVLDKTKFRAGDIIQSIDGKEINTLDDVYAALADKNPGDTVTIGTLRINLLNGENETFDVEVTFPEEETEAESTLQESAQ